MQTTHACHLLVQSVRNANIVPARNTAFANELENPPAQILHRPEIGCAYLAQPGPR
jgi:hypothetical protein